MRFCFAKKDSTLEEAAARLWNMTDEISDERARESAGYARAGEICLARPRRANRATVRRVDRTLAGQTDLVVLPEMFTTGFTMAAEQVAEPVDGPTTALAARDGATAERSCHRQHRHREDHGRYFNRLIWMQPDGHYDTYDKRTCFAWRHEHEHYAAGTRRFVVDLEAGAICPLVCYDLRFPVWSRNRIGTVLATIC